MLKPMLALDAAKLRKPEEDPAGIPAALRFPAVAQEKLDGIRVMVQHGQVVTRTLKPVPNREIREALARPEFEGLDGEVIVGEPTDEDCYRKTASFVMADDKTGEPWTFMVFDSLDVEGDFWTRYGAARSELAAVAWEGVPVHMVNTREVATAADLVQFELDLLACGYEGVIVRDPAQPYKHGRGGKRDQSLVKLKRYIDFEAVVIGVYEEMHNGNEAVTNALGRTERSTKAEGKSGKDRLGGLYLRALNGPCEGIEFKCGTGFDAATRVSLWQDSIFGGDGINGHVAKVKSFPVGVKDKPRHPVFLGWRVMEYDS